MARRRTWPGATRGAARRRAGGSVRACVALAEALGGTPGPETPATKRASSRAPAAIARGLRIDPDERWPDLGALVAALMTEPTSAAASHARGCGSSRCGGAAAAVVAIVVGCRPADPTRESGSEGAGRGDKLLVAGPGWQPQQQEQRPATAAAPPATASGAQRQRSGTSGSGSGSGTSGTGNGSGRRDKTTPRTGARSTSTPAAPTYTPQGPGAGLHGTLCRRHATREHPDARCRVSFAAFDAAPGGLPARSRPATTPSRRRGASCSPKLHRGRDPLTRSTPRRTLQPTLAQEVGREVRMFCRRCRRSGLAGASATTPTQPCSSHGTLSDLTTALRTRTRSSATRRQSRMSNSDGSISRHRPMDRRRLRTVRRALHRCAPRQRALRLRADGDDDALRSASQHRTLSPGRASPTAIEVILIR